MDRFAYWIGWVTVIAALILGCGCVLWFMLYVGLCLLDAITRKIKVYKEVMDWFFHRNAFYCWNNRRKDELAKSKDVEP